MGQQTPEHGAMAKGLWGFKLLPPAALLPDSSRCSSFIFAEDLWVHTHHAHTPLRPPFTEHFTEVKEKVIQENSGELQFIV